MPPPYRALLRLLLDHLIRLDEERREDGEAERLGRLEIDDQQEFGWRLHRQARGRRTPQDAIDIRRCPPGSVSKVEMTIFTPPVRRHSG
jgi:hypothetical protein